MSISLQNSRSGIKSFQQSLDALANDMANANTTGYKAKNVGFRELLNHKITEDKLLVSDQAANKAISVGVKSGVTGTDFSQGSLVAGEGELDLAIGGEGFFQVTDQTGRSFLTRDGAFQVNPDHSITDDRHYTLVMDHYLPTAQWPEGKVIVQEDGNVLVESSGQQLMVGKIPIFYPENKAALTPNGDNLYQTPNGTLSRKPLEGLASTIQQGFLENANVDLAKTMTDMIVTQRAYSLNLKVAQSTDELMSMTNAFNQ